MIEKFHTALFFIKCLLMMVIPWYTIDLEIALYPSAFEVIAVYDGKKISNTDQALGLPKGERSYEMIIHFLETEKQGWKYDWESYVPFTTIVSTDRTVYLEINCMPDQIVVNYRNAEGHLVQVSKHSATGCPNEITQVQ